MKHQRPHLTGMLCGMILFFSGLSILADDYQSKLNLFVPGAYQGWKPDTAPLLDAVPGHPGVFEGYVNITGMGTPGFKFTDAPDWLHTNFGFGGPGILSTDGKAPALIVPEEGYYELSADLAKHTWTETKTAWSIIGDATPGGWQNDTKMNYDLIKQVWTVTSSMRSAGSFKFRANNAWLIDFGIDAAGTLQYVDNPLFAYNPKLKNLTVPSDGIYTITLDLHASGKYTYSVAKN